METGGIAYSISKRGVQFAVAKAAWAWGKKKARIFSVAPGNVDTLTEREDLKAFPSKAGMYPLAIHGRPNTPEEFAKVVNVLMSKDAEIIQGVNILVDDGVVAGIKYMKR